MSEPKPPLWSRSVAAALAVSLGITLVGCRGSDTSSMMASARQYRDQGDLKAAVIQLKNIIQQDAEHRPARVLLGELYLDQGDPQSAEKELRRALALGADSVNVTLLLARALLLQGQFEQLLADIKAEAAPAQRPALLAMRANALLGLLKIAPARELFDEALKLKPDAPEALLGLARIAMWEHQPDTARTLLTRALAANPDDIDCLRYQADLLRADGKGEAALALQNKILQRRPHHAQALVDVANIHIDAGRYADARAVQGSARKASGASLGLLYSEAMLAFRENKLPAALDMVQRVLQAAPEHYPSILLAGAVQSALGNYTQAEQHLHKFLQAYAGHPYAGKLLAGVHLGAQRPEDALAVLRPLLVEHPDDPELLALAGEANLRAQHFSVASDYFEKASTMEPLAATLHTGLALSRLGSGDNVRAVDELERAASLERNPAHTGVLLVMTYLRANMPDKALQAVQEMQDKGDNPLLQNLKGGIFMARKDLAGARASFELALALDPAYLPALANLEQLDNLEHKSADSARRYLSALAKAPHDSTLMEAMAGVTLAQRKPAEALAWMEKASAEHPDALPLALRMGALYLRAEQKQKALLLARKLQAGHPDSAEALALLGQAQVANASYADAADSYGRLALLLPASAMAQMRLAQVSVAQKQYPAALTALHKALALEPDLLEARITLVNLLVQLERYGEALDVAAIAQKRQPDAAAGYKLEGDVLSAQGKHGGALNAYERALALQPRGPFLVQVTAALHQLGRAADAEARYADWFRQHPADIPTRLHYASLKLVQNDPKAAIGHYEAVLKIDPDNLVALNDLAWSYQRLGQRQSLGLAQRAFKLAPDNPSVIDTLGWIYLEQGELGRAQPLLQRASALAPNAADIHFHYGTLLARAGDKRGARRELEKALASGNGFARRAEALALLGKL
ncbi:MAG: XrtA/PEP-CTERM system TPR-repeat protein PrsT [Pseudomonadota bacterium]